MCCRVKPLLVGKGNGLAVRGARAHGVALARRIVHAATPVCIALLCMLLLGPVPQAVAAPDSEAELRDAIKDERAREKARRDSLSRLSAQERGLNANLAAAEDRIALLESKVGKQEAELALLESAVGDVRKTLEGLEAERVKSEAALGELLRLLWPLHVRQEGTGGRDLEDWQEAEREYVWTQEIYRGIDARRSELRHKEEAISASLEKREALMAEVKEQVSRINADRAALLQDKLTFRQQLNDVRREKQDAEEELRDVLALIQNFNVRLEQMAGRDISKLKGRLPWPASGRVIRGWSPEAKPPVRGVGLSVREGAPVEAVAWGKVVHNDVLRGFGRVVILMHDKAYYTLYAFLQNSQLKVGQEVAGGASIGTAGFYPEAKGPGLYFELRFHQKAINPVGWLTSAN